YLSSMLVQGEISNLTRHRSGHWYFTLKDERARLSCVMFASYASKCRVNVRDGMKVIVRGSLSMYEAQGSVQCYVSSIRSDGLGDLYMQYEELRKKLHAEGWFDEAHRSEEHTPELQAPFGRGCRLPPVKPTRTHHYP